MIVLCTYSLQAGRAVDILDVARAHGITIARRKVRGRAAAVAASVGDR